MSSALQTTQAEIIGGLDTAFPDAIACMAKVHGKKIDISINCAAERLTQRIDELNLENSGTFWHSGEQMLSM